MPDASGAVSGRMTLRLVRLLELRERDPHVVAKRADVSVDELRSPAARIPYRLADRFLEACVEELGADGFAVDLAAVFDETTYDAAGLALLSSSTLREGLERAFAYQRLWGDGERFTLRVRGDRAVIRFRHPGPSPIARAILSELALLETLNAVRLLVDPLVRPIAVRFSHRATAGLEPVFGIVPESGAVDSELVLEASLLEASLRPPEGVFARVADMLARRALAGLPATASLSARVRAVVRQDPSAFSLGVPDIARRLHMSGRTLQRRLQSEGTSWAEIVDDLRRARAEELARGGIADKEIAFLLGFADPSALVRARARWADP